MRKTMSAMDGKWVAYFLDCTLFESENFTDKGNVNASQRATKQGCTDGGSVDARF